ADAFRRQTELRLAILTRRRLHLVARNQQRLLLRRHPFEQPIARKRLLRETAPHAALQINPQVNSLRRAPLVPVRLNVENAEENARRYQRPARPLPVSARSEIVLHRAARSEERRVGKECRSRWSPY